MYLYINTNNINIHTCIHTGRHTRLHTCKHTIHTHAYILKRVQYFSFYTLNITHCSAEK